MRVDVAGSGLAGDCYRMRLASEGGYAVAKEKMVPVRFELETYEGLQKIAKRQDRSVAYVVRKACEEYIRRQK